MELCKNYIFYCKIADFSLIVNISIETKFEVMRMLLWSIKPNENKAPTKTFIQRYTKTQTWNNQFYGIHGICGKRKTFGYPFHKLKFVLMVFLTWFNLTFIFILIFFLLCGATVFKMALHFRKKKWIKLTWKATCLELKPSFYIFSECCKVLF